MNLSTTQIAAVFTEWDRRYREDPEEFMPEAVHLLSETPDDYGPPCAYYFEKLAHELGFTAEPPEVGGEECATEEEAEYPDLAERGLTKHSPVKDLGWPGAGLESMKGPEAK